MKIAIYLGILISVTGCVSNSTQPTAKPHASSEYKNRISYGNALIATNYITITNVVVTCHEIYLTNFVSASFPNLKDKDGHFLGDIQDKSLRLEPGMTQDEVVLLIGKPDETSAGTYGTNTHAPWNGITWSYRWGKIADYPNFKALTIIFEKGTVGWVINSWQWSA